MSLSGGAKESRGPVDLGILQPGSARLPRALVALFGLLFLAGAVQFLAGVSGDQARRAWQAYLVSFVFFTGLSAGAVLFSAVLNMANAGWARPLKRLSEAMGAFLPLAFVLFWVLWFGREEIFSWIHEPVHGKEAWLSPGFLFLRNGAALLLLAAASLGLVYFSVREDRAALLRFSAGAGRESRTEDSALEKSWRAQAVLSPILAILYALVLSLLAFDLIMSLDPHWFSTLFGAYYFMGSFYSALAALVLVSGLARLRAGLGDFIRPEHFYDLGKLLLGFCLVTGDFFYSQFLVIWYGNMPEETRYVILRVRETPWEPLAWAVLIACFALPFVVLLSRRVKFLPGAMTALAGGVLCGMWLERFLLVVPSTWKAPTFPLGLLEVSIAAGFLGLFGLSLGWFMGKFSPLPLSDPLFRKTLEGGRRTADARRDNE